MELAEQANKALSLRRAGATYEQVAEQLGLSNRSVAYKLVKRSIADIPRENAEELVAIELERIEAVVRGGLFEKARRADLQAIDRLVRLMERKAKLLGLDAATGPGVAVQVNMSGSLVGHPEYEQLKAMVRRVMERFPETVAAFREEWDALRMDE